MSVPTPQRKPEAEDLAAAEVEDFLRRQPEFFQERPELLESLKLPHPCGEAVSLVSRQIDLLRARNRQLHSQLDDILQIARDNDALTQRLHQLALALLDAIALEDALAGLKWGLHQYFQAEFAAVRILRPRLDSPVADLCPAVAEDAAPAWFEAVLDAGKPHCGPLQPKQACDLFGAETGGEVASCALVPLQHAGLRGLLAIGSRDPARFQAGMGGLFLSRLGEIVAARLAVLANGLA